MISNLILFLSIVLMCVHIQPASGECCTGTPKVEAGLFGESIDVCSGCGSCNIFCCNCDGGCCNNRKRSFYDSTTAKAHAITHFENIDANNNTYVEFNEFLAYLQNRGMIFNTTEAHTEFNEMDTNHDGVIEGNEMSHEI